MTPWSQIASGPPLVGVPEWGSDVMIRTREGRPVATGGLLTHFGVTVCSWQRTQGRWGSAGKQWVLAILAIARVRQSVTATAVGQGVIRTDLYGVDGDPTPSLSDVLGQFVDRSWLIIGDGIQADGAKPLAGQPFDLLDCGTVLPARCTGTEHRESMALALQRYPRSDSVWARRVGGLTNELLARRDFTWCGSKEGRASTS
jgi:hypothetical protein